MAAFSPCKDTGGSAAQRIVGGGALHMNPAAIHNHPPPHPPQQGCCCAFSSGELTCILTFTVWLFGRRCECAERDVCRLKDGYCSPEPWTDLLPPGRRVRVKNLACFVCSKKIPKWSRKKEKVYRTLVQQASPWQRSHRWLKEPRAFVQTVAAPQRPFDFQHGESAHT